MAVDRVDEGDAVLERAAPRSGATSDALIEDPERRALLSRLHRRVADHAYGDRQPRVGRGQR